MILIPNFDALKNAGFMPMNRALLSSEHFLAALTGPQIRLWRWNYIIYKYLELSC
jgi:hypothetical protein